MTYPFYQPSASHAEALLHRNQHLKTPNVGLFFGRFYDGFQPDWGIERDSKKSFIERTARLASQREHEEYAQKLADRQQRLCESLGGVCMTLQTTGPFVTGSGISHPVENGFTFHPTLGLPYLPASGVKGLLRGWVETWMEHTDQTAKDALIADWFGYSTKEASAAGNLVFFDALPAGLTSMACDIMTPHMGGWYEKGDSINATNFAQVAPGDWHSPVPVPFLVVQSGVKFLWGIAPRLSGDAANDAQRREQARQALAQLKLALEWVGAGAKTAVGYGRMVDTAAEEAQKSVANLASSGIALGEEVWEAAKLSWDKGKVELSVRGDGKSAAPLAQQKARDMCEGLTPEDKERLQKKGKTITARAVVKVTGNLYALVSLSSL